MAGLALTTGASLATERPDDLTCVAVFAEARYGAFAYNHIVRIANGCPVDVACTVATDVNPEPQSVIVASGNAVEVVTFLGSPARTFTPVVRCTRAAAPSDRGAR